MVTFVQWPGIEIFVTCAFNDCAVLSQGLIGGYMQMQSDVCEVFWNLLFNGVWRSMVVNQVKQSS